MNELEHAVMMLTLGRHDLAALRAMKGSPEFANTIFGFHAQQAVEKALKAWLTLAGRRYPKIHDLEELFALLMQAGQTVPHEFPRLIYLTDFAGQFRYDVYEASAPALDQDAVIREVAAVVEHVERLVADAKPEAK